MLLNCPVNGNAQSREPVNQDYSRASKRQKETIIRFKNIAFPLPHSLYLNLHLIGSLQHCQNYILRTRRSFQTFMPCYVHGSEPLRKKDRAFFCKRFRKQQIPDTMRDGKLILTSVRNQYPPTGASTGAILGPYMLVAAEPHSPSSLYRWLLPSGSPPLPGAL